MSRIQQDDIRLSHGVSLLISILVRFPEIATIKFDALHDLIIFRLMIKRIPNKKILFSLKEQIISCIKTYNLLLEQKEQYIDISFEECEQIVIFTITRDVKSISRGEIAVVIAILHDALKDIIICDTNETLQEEDLIIQEELIDNMLDRVTKEVNKPSLIGIREDGKVLVFNK